MKLLKKLMYWAIGLIFLFLIVAVFYSNQDVVQVSLLPSFPFSIQLGLLIVFTFLVGLICGALILFSSLLTQKLKIGMVNLVIHLSTHKSLLGFIRISSKENLENLKEEYVLPTVQYASSDSCDFFSSARLEDNVF